MTYEGVGAVGYVDQVLCTRYSEGGDSGSLVLEEATDKAVGLHFAGSLNGSIFSPISVVLKMLGADLVVTDPQMPEAAGPPATDVTSGQPG